MRLLLLFSIATTLLFGLNIKKSEAVTIKELKDGTMRVKIAMNYENPIEMSRRIRGVDGMYTINLPIPENWKVLSAKGYLSYSPSILLQKDHSAGVINFNNMSIKQFKLFKYEGTGIKFSIKPNYIKEYNQLRIEMIQHYTDNYTNKCEDGASSQLWTDINLVDSYIEFHIEKIAIPEEIHSLTTYMLDGKQYKIDPINYVVSKKPKDEELRQYALITGAIANSIQYRMAPISVSNELNLAKHNVVVATKANIKKRLLPLKDSFLFENDPIYSLHFNDKSLKPLLNDGISSSVSKSGVSLKSKYSFHGKSLYLHGGKISLKDLPVKNSEDITVAFWFKQNSKKQKAILFGFDKYKLVLNRRHIGFTTQGKDLYGGKLKLDKRWHHLIAKFNSKNIKKNSIYIDGKKIRLRQISGKSRESNLIFNDSAIIGGQKESSKLSYYGYLDQFYLFDKALGLKTTSKLYKLAKQNRKKSYSEALFISEKILHDINIIRNPVSPDKVILVIAPYEESKIFEVITGFYRENLSLYFRQGLNIESVEIPKKAEAYSADGYIPIETEITFRELGYETTVLRGWYPPSVSIDFKVYPDHYFNSKDRIKAHLNYVFPTTVNNDSVSNIFINGKFAKQIDIMEASKSQERGSKMGGLLESDNMKELPVYLIDKGHNKIKFEFSLVPNKKNICKINNTQNLLIMLMDNSYFSLPSSDRWIEMPYMEYLPMSGYPYSIYPDLQDTQIVLTNTDIDTISASMNFIFFLTQEIHSHPYYLNITQNIEDADKERQIVMFGSIHDTKMQTMSENAPVTFNEIDMNKPYPFIKRFVDKKSIVDEERLKKYRYISKMKETNQLDDNILVQMFKSPYNNEKTVLMFVGEKPQALNKGVQSIITYKNRHYMKGDTVIYNPVVESGVSLNIKDKYIITNMGIIDKINLYIGMNPILYISVLIVFIFLLAWFIRNLLLELKKRNHPYVD